MIAHFLHVYSATVKDKFIFFKHSNDDVCHAHTHNIVMHLWWVALPIYGATYAAQAWRIFISVWKFVNNKCVCMSESINNYYAYTHTHAPVHVRVYARSIISNRFLTVITQQNFFRFLTSRMNNFGRQCDVPTMYMYTALCFLPLPIIHILTSTCSFVHAHTHTWVYLPGLSLSST